MIRNWLDIQPAPSVQSITILEPLSFEANVAKNQIWYRGDASELDQLYKQLATDSVGNARFWAATPQNETIRKLHSGLPALLVDTLAYIVKADLADVEFEGGAGKLEWERMTESEINFAELVGDAVADTLICGDGAFKLSIDTDISPYPIAEFYPADRVEYVASKGRIFGVDFITRYQVDTKEYLLKEEYRTGSVRYHLYCGEREVALEEVPELHGLKSVDFDPSFMMAVPLRFYKNPKFRGRGKSIYDTKTDDFDALDEVISQWMDAVRSGRVRNFIPEDMLPRNPKDGSLERFNPFGGNYIAANGDAKENAVNRIETIQPDIRYEAYLTSYATALDLCLHGILSPATLGIDVGKMSSAEAQREKKDITGHTRNTITAALELALPKLVSAILMTYDVMRGKAPGSYLPSVSFGEYGAPDFDSRCDTINRAAAAGTMSIEAQVDELWGTSKDEAWKLEEVTRIKRDKGIEILDEPAAGVDV
ncbi:capsid protein [Ligaoa zhengdingensis]|uniref:capsid protein n=1 Tax=Ligaoa zhengdingensis TaxID=2763658 RepID=UPI0031BA8C26